MKTKSKVLGYCKLCRAKEIETYGTLVRGKRHQLACKEAGCKHPIAYWLPEGGGMLDLCQLVKSENEFDKLNLRGMMWVWSSATQKILKKIKFFS